MEEAFQYFCDSDGNFDISKLNKMFKQLGYPKLSYKEIDIMKECLDVNKDKKITLQDLKEIFKFF